MEYFNNFHNFTCRIQ